MSNKIKIKKYCTVRTVLMIMINIYNRWLVLQKWISHSNIALTVKPARWDCDEKSHFKENISMIVCSLRNP